MINQNPLQGGHIIITQPINKLINDNRLSIDSRGLYMKLVAFDKGYFTSIVELAEHCMVSKRVLKKYLSELVKYGYMTYSVNEHSFEYNLSCW